MTSLPVVPEGSPAPTGGAEAAPTAENFDDVVLAQILGEQSAAPAAAPEQPKPEGQPSAEAGPESQDGEVEIDLTPLQLQGVPKSVLDALPKSALKEWSAQAREREAKRSTDFQQRAEEAKQAKAEAARLRDELGRFTKPPEAAADAERKPTADVDLEGELKPLVDELRELGVPAGDKLASALKKAQAAQAARVEGLSTVNQQLANEMLNFFVDDARSKLAAQYPQLSNDETYARVREEFDAELASGRYKDSPSLRAAVSKALDKSARVVLFDEIVKSHVEKVQSNHRDRLAGQPTAPTRQPQPRPMTPEERDDRIADLLLAGKSEEARKLARG